ncbi:20755_t:CDS:2 [Entrophospora sp. SA101]|nr:23149_t:CDS:2 [Entrophospora sp. SA101]CAJ0766369.1 20755_t:CDS:2 [Entrophospora sp. SA101]CAJ0830103.1 2504_t:CDS:2 [Entrophospora sp. SA101]CAJ0911561.1 22648_t:CDS:2 [Entrophospora sp. SA101]CAJ0927408.1 7720_t:CDS:2 [Entrophospora sp. SA101]
MDLLTSLYDIQDLNNDPTVLQLDEVVDLDYLSRISYTELLEESYNGVFFIPTINHHNNNCCISSPDDTFYNLKLNGDDHQPHFPFFDHFEEIDNNNNNASFGPSMYDVTDMTRTFSSESGGSCPDLTNCSHPSICTTPLISSPQDQSPIMTSQLLINHLHHHDNSSSNNVIIITSPPLTTISPISISTNHNHNICSSTSSDINDDVAPTPKRRGRAKGSRKIKNDDVLMLGILTKSRGRRMNNNNLKITKPGTKTFECTYSGCGRVFKRSEHLKRHIRSIHTLERRKFSRSDNLTQHIRVHRPNGKEKNTNQKIFNNFTPYLKTYQETTSSPTSPSPNPSSLHNN